MIIGIPINSVWFQIKEQAHSSHLCMSKTFLYTTKTVLTEGYRMQIKRGAAELGGPRGPAAPPIFAKAINRMI